MAVRKQQNQSFVDQRRAYQPRGPTLGDEIVAIDDGNIEFTITQQRNQFGRLALVELHAYVRVVVAVRRQPAGEQALTRRREAAQTQAPDLTRREAAYVVVETLQGRQRVAGAIGQERRRG